MNITKLAAYAQVERSTIYRWRNSDLPEHKERLRIAIEAYEASKGKSSFDYYKALMNVQSSKELTTFLKARGKGIRYIAKGIGVSQQTIHRHVDDDSKREKMLKRIARFL